MKKKAAKLSLNRETIRSLTKEHLSGLAGGITGGICTTQTGPTEGNLCNFTHATCSGCIDC
jgi:hypothetical protein